MSTKIAFPKSVRPSRPRSPWQRAYVERVIGSIRRDCLDHLFVFNERSLRRILRSYLDCYHGSRTHLSLREGLARVAIDSPAGSRARGGAAPGGRAASFATNDSLLPEYLPALPQIHSLVSVPKCAHTLKPSPARSTTAAKLRNHGRMFAEKRFVPRRTAFSLGTS